MTKKKVKVVLNKIIDSEKRVGDIIEVAYGYARNYLLPNQLASLATNNVLKKLYKRRMIHEQQVQTTQNQLSILRNYLEKIQKFSIRKKMRENYRFFGSILAKDISKLIFNATGTVINRKQIRVLQMHQVGYYSVQIKLLHSIVVTIWIQVLPLFTEVNIN